MFSDFYGKSNACQHQGHHFQIIFVFQFPHSSKIIDVADATDIIKLRNIIYETVSENIPE